MLLPTSTPTSVPTAAFESEVIANLNAAGLSNSVPFYQQMFNLYNSAPGASAARDVLAPGATVATPATDTTPAIASVPTPDGCSTYLPTTFTGPCAVQFRSVAGNETHERIYAGRVDFNFGSNDRMFVRYQQDHGFQATYTDPISPIFNLGSTQPEYQSQLTETHTFGTSAVNQLIIFGQWYSAIFGPKSQSAAVAAFPASLWLGDNTLYPLGFYNFFWPQGRNVTQYGFSDDFSKSKGAHSLKFGVKYRRNDVSDQDYGYYVNPYLLPFSLADFANGGIGIQQNCGNTCGDLSVQNFPLSLNQPMATWGLGAYAQDAWKVKPNLTVNFALRIEHNSNPVCQHDCFARLTGPWNEIAHDPATPYNQALLVSQHQALSGLQSIVWEPRIGFSWQPLGASRNTVIRGGIGIFGDAFPAGVADNFSSNPPLLNSFTIYNDNLSPVETSNLFNDAASSNQSFLSGFKAGQTVDQIEAENPNFSPPSMTVSDKQTKVPTYEKWSMEIEHGFGEHATFSVSYVGNHGYHETVANAAVNAYESGFSGLPSAPPDSRFGPVGWITTAGTSSYNGLTASLRAQTHSATVLLNYTWSHGFDTVSNGGLLPFNYSTNLSPLSPMNPYNIQANRADSDYDVRHYLSASYVWQLPFKGLTRGHGPAALVNGWQVSGTIFTRTGLPYTPYDGSDGAGIYNYGAAQLYANFNGGTVSSCSSPQNPCLTATQFSSAATGFGNVLRNSFRGPGYFDTDFSLLKYTNIPHWEGAKLAVGAQAYNVFNHPNFDIPDANIDSSTFGTVIHTVGSPTSILGAFLGGDASVRMIQLTARIVF